MSLDKRKLLLVAAIFASLLLVLAIGSASADESLTPKQALGRELYFDATLSQPTGQSCASCHDPEFGFVDPDAELPVSEGVFPGKFGDRNSPSAAYAMFSPILHLDAKEGLWIGGQFWDGRATGDVLGDPLADQALGPFLNPVEMANTSKTLVIRDVANSSYRALFESVWGADLSNWSQLTAAEIEKAYDQVALSIAAFERTALFAPFSSKYDAYLKACLELGGQPDHCALGSDRNAESAASMVGYTDLEWQGLQLFMGSNNNDGQLKKNEGAMCSACHIAEWALVSDLANTVIVPAWAPEGLAPPMFTDFTFDNLGVPKNSSYPLNPDSPADLGLGVTVGDPAQNGKFKVMTLRNIGQTAPYAHNGFFLSLKEITNFYNTRDVADWPPPEYADTVNFDELGNLGLSGADEDALVAFMKTLDDGFMP